PRPISTSQTMRRAYPGERRTLVPALNGRCAGRTRFHHTVHAELEFAAVAAEFAATEAYEVDGAHTPVEWIRHERRVSTTAASHAVAVGEQAQRLPESLVALDEGRLGYGHLARWPAPRPMSGVPPAASRRQPCFSRPSSTASAASASTAPTHVTLPTPSNTSTSRTARWPSAGSSSPPAARAPL